ncbi:MAG: PepSY domain-containing protein [Colwellia sp.]
MLKITLRRIHLILALISGLFLISLSISGALLLYAKDIQTFVNPQYWLLTDNSNQQKQTLLTLSEITTKIEQQTKQKIQFIQPEHNQQVAWQVRLVNKHYLSINPYTGHILLTYHLSDTFYGFIMSWHRWLLYSNNTDEKPMQLWISIASLIFIIELIIGFSLWIKPKHRLKRLKVRWQAKNKIRFIQLHGSIGILFCIPLILIAFSGIAFFWQDASKQIVEWVSFSKIQQHNYQNKPLTQQGEYKLNKAYNIAHLALASGSVYRIYLPQAHGNPLALRIKMPNESHAYSWSWANPYTGKLIHSFDASKSSLATQIWNFKYKFHIGEFIGWPVKVLWLIVSLLPCFFVLSGIYLWIKRQPTANISKVKAHLSNTHKT